MDRGCSDLRSLTESSKEIKTVVEECDQDAAGYQEQTIDKQSCQVESHDKPEGSSMMIKVEPLETKYLAEFTKPTADHSTESIENGKYIVKYMYT